MPLSLAQEVVDIFSAQSGVLDDIAPNLVHTILKLLDNAIQAQAPQIYEEIDTKKTFSNESKEKVLSLLNGLKANVQSEPTGDLDELDF